jgi:hypothetical protein
MRVSVLECSPVFDSLGIFPLVGRLAVELPASRKFPIAVPEDFERPLTAPVAIDCKLACARNRNLDLVALFELERLYYSLRRQTDRQAIAPFRNLHRYTRCISEGLLAA